MKYIDYACYDYSINEAEVELNVASSIKLGIKNIAIFPYSVNTVKNMSAVKDNNINLYVAADFPFGLSDLKTRNFLVTQLAKNNISGIDLFIPTKIVSNRKYDKFREDVRTNLEICQENNVKLRYILEYRVYSHEVLAKVCQILLTFGIDSVFPSSGIMIDDVSDNLIACNFLSTKSKINTICTGNCYNSNQVSIVKNNTNLYGMRFFHIPNLASFVS
jgi:deoxyribose-phosphate aldolase